MHDYSIYTAEDFNDKNNYDLYGYLSDISLSADEISNRNTAAYERAETLGASVLFTYKAIADPLYEKRQFIDTWTVSDSFELLSDDVFRELSNLHPLDRPQAEAILFRQAKKFGCDKQFRDKMKAVEQAIKSYKVLEPRQGYTKRNNLKSNTEILQRLKRLNPVNYHYSDRGTSDLFADMFRHEIRYNTTAKEWYYFNGKVWAIDNGGMYVHSKAKDFFDALIYYSVSIEDEETAKKFRDYYGKYGSKNKRDTLVKDSADCCCISSESFDRDPNLFNCQNGTFDLRTMKLHPHSSEDFITKISNVVYDEKAVSKEWEKFISEVLPHDNDKIRYFQKAIGYCIGGACSLETCFILYGATTRNGKSTALNTIAYMLGGSNGYAMTAEPQTLALKNHKDSRAPSEDIARLAGCRFLNVSEPPQSMAFDVALLKTLTGNDPIKARFLFQGSFEFIPQFTIFINTNYLPRVLDETIFASDRINVIPFDVHFDKSKRDEGLKARLKTPENIAGLFNWCMEGLKAYRMEGLNRPYSVGIATAAYAKQSDKLGNFIDECFEECPGSGCTAKDAYDAYKQWCSNSGYYTEGKQKFLDLLKCKNMLRSSATLNGITHRNVITGYKLCYSEATQITGNSRR